MTRALHIAKGLNLPLDAVTETIAVLAKRGSGKTYTASVFAEELLKAGQPLGVLDPTGAWYGLRSSADGKGEGFPITILGGDHADVPLDEAAGKDVAEILVQERVPLVLDLSRMSKAAMRRFVADFAEHLYQKNREPLHLIIDEADAFAPQKPRPDEMRMLGAIDDIVRRGRIRGLGVTLVTQRSAVLNKDVLTQAEVLITLRTPHPKDRAPVLEWMKVHATPEQMKQVEESLAGLEIGEAWVMSAGWLDIFKRVRIRKRETFNSSATPKPGEKRIEPRKLAQVDLDALQKKFAHAIEQAKATDPKTLQKQLAEARAEIKKLQAAKAPAAKVVTKEVVKVDSRMGVLVKKLQKAVEQAMKFIVTINTEGFFKAGGDAVDKAQVQKAIEAAVANVTKMLEQKVEQRNRDIDKLRAEASKVLASLKALTLEDISVEVAVKHNEPFTVRTQQPPSPVPRGAPLPGTDTKLNRGAREMLRALAAFPERGLTRAELGVHAVLGYQTGTFSDYLSAMRRAGFIADEGQRIRITVEGNAAAGGRQPAREWAELVAAWTRGKVGGGARRMLEALAHSREPTPRERLGEQAQLGHETGTFSDYLSLLRRNGLIEEGPNRGEVKAAEALFLSETASG